MALVDSDYINLRRYVGSSRTESEIDDAFERLGSLRLVALEFLEIVIADFLVNPLQFNIVSEYGQNASNNIQWLYKMRAEVTAADDTLTPGAIAKTSIAFVVPNIRSYGR